MFKPNDAMLIDLWFKPIKILKTVESTCSCALVESFLKEDDTTEIFKSTGSGEKQLPKSTPVGFNILYTDAGQTLANCPCWLISSKNTLSRSANVRSIGDKLICKQIHQLKTQHHTNINHTKIKKKSQKRNIKKSQTQVYMNKIN